jgi:hypothetical protein
VGSVTEAVFNALFGWILELVPLDISATRRERLYKNGRRVYLRVRVSGLTGATFVGFVAAERGTLWLATRRDVPETDLVPLLIPDDWSEVTISNKVTWNQDRYIAYAINGKQVSIFCKQDWDLLRRAFDDAMASRT